MSKDNRIRRDNHVDREVPLTGRRTGKSPRNSLQFFARIEGETDHDGRIRGANGMKWVLS